jgi:hypothetical protein
MFIYINGGGEEEEELFVDFGREGCLCILV